MIWSEMIGSRGCTRIPFIFFCCLCYSVYMHVCGWPCWRSHSHRFLGKSTYLKGRTLPSVGCQVFSSWSKSPYPFSPGFRSESRGQLTHSVRRELAEATQPACENNAKEQPLLHERSPRSAEGGHQIELLAYIASFTPLVLRWSLWGELDTMRVLCRWLRKHSEQSNMPKYFS